MEGESVKRGGDKMSKSGWGNKKEGEGRRGGGGAGGVGEPRSFEKIGGGNLPRRTLWSWRLLLRIH